eukprot:4943904-Pleurochrysis_carterae.AAC.2
MTSYNVGDFVQVTWTNMGINDESCKILRKDVMGVIGSFQLQRANGMKFALFGKNVNSITGHSPENPKNREN